MLDKRLIDMNTLPNHKLRITARLGEFEMPGDLRIVFWEDIEKAPTIDAVEVVHGRWILGVPITCSLCGKPAAQHDSPNSFWMSPYCPWCGQPMDAKDMNVPTKDGGAE